MVKIKRSVLSLCLLFSVFILIGFISATFISSNLSSPANATISANRNQTVIFNFTSDYNSTFNCTLYINGISNVTNTSVINATSTTFLANFSTDGFYQWYVNCTDSNGGNYTMTNQSEVRYITIDNATNPTAVQGSNPVSYYNSTSSSVAFDFKCYDNAAVSVVQLWTDVTGTWAVNYTNNVSNNTWSNITVPGILDGTYRWAVWCNDSVALINMSQNRTFSVNSAPSVTLNNPTSYQNISSTSPLYLNCTAADTGGLLNITMFSWFSNGTSFANNTLNVSGLGNYSNSSITPITNYSYNWTCVTCDNGSACTTAGNSTFLIDTNAPSVTLESPEDGGTVTSLKPTLEYSVSHYRAIKNCSLYLDDVFKTGDSDAEVGDNSITLSTSLGDGLTYDWFIECFDYAGNKAQSEEWRFTVDTGGGSSGGGGSGDDDEEQINITTAQSTAKLAGDVSQGDKTVTGLVRGDRVNFTLGSVAHSLTIINVTSNYTAIEIRSTLITAVIEAGKTKSFDLDGNGVDDFAITVQGISALRKINLILKSVKGTPVNATNNITTPGTNASSTEINPFSSIKWDSVGKFFKNYWYYVLIGLVVIAAVVLGIVFREKIFRKNKYWWRKGANVRLK